MYYVYANQKYLFIVSRQRSRTIYVKRTCSFVFVLLHSYPAYKLAAAIVMDSCNIQFSSPATQPSPMP